MVSAEIIIALLTVIIILAVTTQPLKIPYPVIFIIGGLLLGLIPELPPVLLDPHLVFLLFVPPILFSAGYFTSLRDFRANLRPISLLAIVLVALTTFGIAAVFKWLLPGMPWVIGCVLGAIISPPDAVAATSIMHRLKIPKRIVTIVEGESLFNDAIGLILYRFAVAAVVTGSFSMADASIHFVSTCIGGILVGLIIGWIIAQSMARMVDTTVSIAVTLVTPFIIYIIAEKLSVSGILAVVVAGMMLGWHAPRAMSAKMRLRGHAVWDLVSFLLNGIMFVLMGLQLRIIMTGLGHWSHFDLARLALAVVGAAIVIRFFWVFFAAYVIRAVLPSVRRYDPYPPWQGIVVIAWAGMRGIVSLGAALALPITVANGTPFPARDLIIFLAFTTIIGTLVFQGITLPLLIKWLGLKQDDIFVREEQEARAAIGQAMLEEIEKLQNNHSISKRAFEIANRECLVYSTSLLSDDVDEQEAKDCAKEIRTVRRKLIKTGRQRLIELRHSGAISDEVLHAIQREFDLDELRLS